MADDEFVPDMTKKNPVPDPGPLPDEIQKVVDGMSTSGLDEMEVSDGAAE